MQIVSIPQEVLEVAYTVRNQYPDLTPEEVAIELLKQSVEAEKQELEDARELAIKRLKKLSPEAFNYVLKPLEWACKFTDGIEEDDLSMEDSLRYHLICQALHGSDKFVEILCQWGHSLSRAMREKEVQA